MNTATCAECDIGWSGDNAHEKGLEHEKATNHVVWYDENPEITEEAGPYDVKWDLV